MATIHVRTDEKLKKEASKVLEGIGLDMSTGIKLFLTQVVATSSIPFAVKTVESFTDEERKSILAEREKLIKNIKAGKVKTFSSAKALHTDILK